MKQINKKFIGKKLVFILLLILFIKEITAIGIVTMYLENNILEVMEGTSETYEIQLQNTEEEIEVRLVLDSEIAEIIDYKERYVLPAGISNTPIIFDITAPKDAKVGDEYVISYYMEQISTKGGMVPFGVKINKHLTVKIIEDPDKPGTGYLYGVIIGGIVLVLFVIIFIWKYKKSKNNF